MTARKDDILAFLKSRGHSSLQEVADHLGLTKQGALRHLEALQATGLVQVATEERHVRGRPEHVYRLTPAAVEHFPASHRELAGEMAHFMPANQLERFFQLRAAKLEAEYAGRLTGLDLRERVYELARLASEHGHMAEVIDLPDGSLALRQCNCPIADVAAEVRHPCHEEMEMYARLLGAELERSSFIPENGTTCTYRVRGPRTGPPPLVLPLKGAGSQ